MPVGPNGMGTGFVTQSIRVRVSGAGSMVKGRLEMRACGRSNNSR